jgi:F-type H+-transporting ATPase subunit gamma
MRAQQKVAAARPYSEQITEVIRNLSAAGAGAGHPLLSKRENVANVGIVVVTADRGMAGAYNSAVIRQAEEAIAAAKAEGAESHLFVVGRKGVKYFTFEGVPIVASFTGFSDNPSYENAREIAAEVIGRFDAGELDSVELAYTQFLSVGSQKPVLRRFVPLEALPGGEEASSEGPQADYEYEPEPEVILDRLLPRYVEARLFAALLDAAASEHAARQRAMKSATDNAGELIKRLDRAMNRARQDAITTELIEISSAAEALAESEQEGPSGSHDIFRDLEIDFFREAQSAPHHQHDRKHH